MCRPPRFIVELISEFVLAELLRLETIGCIRRVDYVPHIVNPLTAVHSKKWRVVLDASLGLNPFCVKRKIVLDDLRSLSYTLMQNDY